MLCTVASLGDEDGDDALVRTDALPALRSPRFRVKLAVLSGPDAGKTYPLAPGRYRVGSEATSDIVLPDRSVSRQHLVLEVREDGVRAVDPGSRNGSFCEGMRFSELEVRPGATLTLGTTELKLVPEGEKTRALPLSSRSSFGGLVGNSRRMREVFTLLERLAQGESDVLIQGETGTGKELCAEAIHTHGMRSKGPFVIADLAGIPPQLLESELFGHVKGAFTGAHGDRAGAFERAHGGTLFLDEVGELPLEVQPRLLRVLERRQVKRVGANDYRTFHVRVVAATHQDLEGAVKQGRFRGDLFHRLAVLRVVLPPLRERPDDIPLLIDTVLARLGKPPSALSDVTRALLTQYPWPGNVRELRNVVDRVVSLGEEALPDIPDVPAPVPPPEDDSESTQSLALDLPFKEAKERLIEGFERDYLRNLVERCEGNVSRAAREAGIDRVYLRKLLRKHGLESGGP
ncbi:sigma 54-interacting transcriptional regulator [Myxococcus sp. CA051A]|uniref:FHA domain-containing protein n=2 Tax=Myxococcaceae TaxID=31 RepID=A0A540X457_9BACT|nr:MULTISPECIES: sigma 54-interacting transcriptional regulator [Myxococcus]NTX06773.1 sigma 54-interacting transcriptional regulator [Myxococcus sp. CA040A]NTX13916.1 sigma 54-interacting transcriptional regulator [Myxococcus sp. CA056]NTX62533.1 sigma 54-interacting transcriptional regulator [Myxococcus sp. CA051A]TQF16032.1 FHA domain-containing protein [Myxococcus llanfairpwllgwyngyllgogerychwyrndrobwllllantysiliogogogochensis]